MASMNNIRHPWNSYLQITGLENHFLLADHFDIIATEFQPLGRKETRLRVINVTKNEHQPHALIHTGIVMQRTTSTLMLIHSNELLFSNQVIPDNAPTKSKLKSMETSTHPI